MKRRLYVGATLLALIAAPGLYRAVSQAQGRGGGQAPNFQVDPLWPRPLPNSWILGSVTGVAVDDQDNVWITHRGAPTLTARTENGFGDSSSEVCCGAAPLILKFDPAGNLVGQINGPGAGYSFPRANSGLSVDAKGNVWIAGISSGTIEGRPETQAPAAAAEGGRGGRGGGAGARGEGQRAAAGGAPAGGGAAAAGARGEPQRGGGGGGRGGAAAPAGPQDAHVLKFNRYGRMMLQIGAPGKVEGNESKTTLNLPTAVDVDVAANEVYVADGGVFKPGNLPSFGNNNAADTRVPVYGNSRIVVFDSETGAYKRHWGAYGSKPEDASPGPYNPNATPSKQFKVVSCVRLANDGLVYVCDRENNRIQVFQKDGKFVKEAVISKNTLGEGGVWDIAFSRDPQQRFMYVANAQDKKVHVVLRESLQVLTAFGRGGRYPGQFSAVSNVAVDSKGNVYTGETYQGKRVQKFVFKGLAAVPSQNR